MKKLKKAVPVVLGAIAVIAIAGASSASATTLEVGGATQNKSIEITVSLKSGTSAILKDTEGFAANTCTTTHAHGHTTTFTGGTVTVEGDSLVNQNCTRTVTTHDPGDTEIKWTSGTNGTVFSVGAVLTAGSPFGTLTCSTGTTHIGTLTGTASGFATMDANAVINCGFLIPSAKWEGTYSVTTPTGFGVSP